MRIGHGDLRSQFLVTLIAEWDHGVETIISTLQLDQDQHTITECGSGSGFFIDGPGANAGNQQWEASGSAQAKKGSAIKFHPSLISTGRWDPAVPSRVGHESSPFRPQCRPV